jgi:hypothetical protein
MIRKLIAMALVPFALGACNQTQGKIGYDRVVTTAPTAASMSQQSAVLYDDGKCPDGQIARFNKKRGAGMGRKCVPAAAG